MPVHKSKFDIRQRVTIDGYADLTGVVVGVLIRETRLPCYEVAWIHNGVATNAWIEEYRLEDKS